MATDIFTLNTTLAATIEESVVKTLNDLRAVWDPKDRYPTYYRFAAASSMSVVQGGAKRIPLAAAIERARLGSILESLGERFPAVDRNHLPGFSSESDSRPAQFLELLWMNASPVGQDRDEAEILSAGKKAIRDVRASLNLRGDSLALESAAL